jgi:hypothetical protein
VLALRSGNFNLDFNLALKGGVATAITNFENEPY